MSSINFINSFSSALTKVPDFSNNLLEYPQYTRPILFKGMKVPDILLSGNHKEIEAWRNDQMKMRTQKKRKDLIKREEN